MDSHFASPLPASSGMIKKVPGQVPSMGRLSHEAQKFQREIRLKSVPELKTILTRQKQVMSNQKLIASLPDKGDKIRVKIEVIEKLLKERSQALDAATSMMNSLTIGEHKVKSVEEMEWKFGGGLHKSQPLDSDDDEDGHDEAPAAAVLKMLTEREVPAKPPCIEDLTLETHAKHLSEKVQSIPKQNRFVPAIAVKKTTSAPESELTSLGLKRRTTPKIPVTELMPIPDESKTTAKEVSVEESMKIMTDYEHKMKEAKLQRILERYREKEAIISSEDESEEDHESEEED